MKTFPFTNRSTQRAREDYEKAQVGVHNGSPIAKVILVLGLAFLTGCAQAQQAPHWLDLTVVGSGVIVSQPRPLSGFDRIEAGQVLDLAVQQDDEFSVLVVADDNWVD